MCPFSASRTREGSAWPEACSSVSLITSESVPPCVGASPHIGRWLTSQALLAGADQPG